MPPKKKLCPNCNGLGVFEDDAECDNCNGQGEVDAT